MKLDKTKPYGIICGHASAAFEQDGRLFDGAGEPIIPETALSKVDKQIIMTDQVASAKAFLLQILKGNALAKGVVYAEAEKNNQDWTAIKNAAVDIGIVKFTFNKSETWRLPEQV